MTSALARPVRAGSGLLLVLSGNMLIDALEVSVAMVALAAIGRELDLSASSLHWVVTGFALGFGGLLLFATRVVAVLGRRRVYLGALLCFAVASAVGALSSTVEVLVATRLVKGFCVALTAPTGLAIIAATFPEGPARRRAVSVYSFVGASGFTVGLVLAGLLTELGWRWTFMFAAPVALLLFGYAVRLVPADQARTGRPYDLTGAAALLGGAVLLTYALSARSVVAGLGSVALLLVFLLVERAAADPLVRLRTVARAALVRSAIGAAALNGSFWGFLLVISLTLQGPLGWSPSRTGLALVPGALPLLVAAPFSGRLVARVGSERLIAIGAALPCAGYALILAVADHLPYVSGLLPALLLVGLGFAAGFAALHVQAVGGVPPEDQPMVSATYQTAVQLGGALTTALVAGLAVGSVRAGMTAVTVVSTAGLLVALAGLAHRRRSAAA